MSGRDDHIPGLEDLSGLYRDGRRPDPPAHLDRRILAAARAPARRRWAVPLSLAASLVLGVGLVGLLRQPTPAPAPAPAEAPAAVGESARPAAPAPPPDRAEPLRALRQAPEAESRAAEPDPGAWLERIADLRRQGRSAEAEALLRAFRDRYPDYPLPPSDPAAAEPQGRRP